MTINELQNRIEQLERQQRRTRTVFLLLIVLGCAAVLMGQVNQPIIDQSIELRQLVDPADLAPVVEPEIHPELRTNSLSIYDRAGKQRGVLSALGDGSVLALFDRNGRTRAELTAAGTNVSLTLYDGEGKTRAVLGSTGLVGSRVAGERAPASSVVLLDGAGRLLSRMP